MEKYKYQIEYCIWIVGLLIAGFLAGYLVRGYKVSIQEEESYRIAEEMESFLLRKELEEKGYRNDYLLRTLDRLENETK